MHLYQRYERGRDQIRHRRHVWQRYKQESAIILLAFLEVLVAPWTLGRKGVGFYTSSVVPAGTLPRSWAALTNLQSLDLSRNNMSGEAKHN